jgi:predicted nucleic acid-binding protein
MIIADTMVVSEIFKPRPEPIVLDWFTRFSPIVLVPTIVISELFAGVEGMDDNERKNALAVKYHELLSDMDDRLPAFDMAAAFEFARLAAHCRRVGAEIKSSDGQIAAIARVYRTPIATRDFKDYRETGVKLINPWEEQ